MRDEWAARTGSPLDTSGWQMHNSLAAVPQQNNGSDCGARIRCCRAVGRASNLI